MKLSLLAISILIAFQATLFLTSATQRYNYHNSIYQIYQFVTGNPNMQECFCCDQQSRYIIVSFMYASAYLLFTVDLVWPAFLAQLIWIIFQSNIITDHQFQNIYKVLIQFLILYVLAENLCNNCCNSQKKSEPENKEVPIKEGTERLQSSQQRDNHKNVNKKPEQQKNSHKPTHDHHKGNKKHKKH